VNDNKSLAIILGAAVGVAAVATTVSIYVARHRDHETQPVDVNEIFQAARLTVKRLDEAVDMLRKAEA
jgi:hypothetical protein